MLIEVMLFVTDRMYLNLSNKCVLEKSNAVTTSTKTKKFIDFVQIEE